MLLEMSCRLLAPSQQQTTAMQVQPADRTSSSCTARRASLQVGNIILDNLADTSSRHQTLANSAPRCASRPACLQAVHQALDEVVELNTVLARVQQHVQALKGRLAQLQPIIHAVLEGTQVHLPAGKDVRVGQFLKFGV